MACYSARKRNELIRATVYGFMPSEKREMQQITYSVVPFI